MHVKTSSETFCRNAGDLFRMKRTRLEMHISLFHANFCVFFSFACLALKQPIHPCKFCHAGADYPRATGYNYYVLTITGRRIDNPVSDEG